MFYCPPGFEATWKRFKKILEADGKNMSQELRIWIEGYVKRHDPGNPQRPITAFVAGHEDEEKRAVQEIYTWIKEYAEEHQSMVGYSQIVGFLKQSGVAPRRRASIAADLAKRLHKDGIQVSQRV